MRKLIFLNLLCVILSSTVSSQSTLMQNNYPALGTPFLGWDGTNPHSVDIANDANQPINFYTSAGGTFANQRMIIKGTGEVGIGTTSPVG